MGTYAVKVKFKSGIPRSCYIDDIKLTGDKQSLISKMRDFSFVQSLGIDSSFYGECFQLVDTNCLIEIGNGYIEIK